MRHAIFLLVLVLCANLAAASPDHTDKEPCIDPDRPVGNRDTYAEQEPNEPCGNDQVVDLLDVIDPGCIDYIGDHDWYSFMAYGGDLLALGTEESIGLPTVDTYIELYADDCVTQLAYDDDSGPGSYSLIIDYEAPYTGIYHLLVRSYGDYTTGCYSCHFNFAPPPPLGACCLDDGTCMVVDEYVCYGQFGSDLWIPDGECDPNPCPTTSVPETSGSLKTTWGRLKAAYR